MAITARQRRVHFIGIGGIGMSGLAEILMELGHNVSGSDIKDSDSVLRLKELGADIELAHSERFIEKVKPDVVVYSTAVSKNNPEIIAANRLHIPIIRRAEMLGELMRLKRGIAIAGSHGKTTTTAMLGLILKNAGIDPTLVIGGRFDAIGSNVAWGGGDWLLAEADESDGTFLKLMPEFCVITNIDAEHLDHYGDFASVCKAFSDFLDHIPFYGKAILCSDSPELRKLSKHFNKPRVWYGFSPEQEPDFLLVKETKDSGVKSVSLKTRSSSFKETVLSFELSVPGLHNLLNASGAAILAMELGVSKEVIRNSLKSFSGVRRRFELKGELSGVKIYEDYAHHPTEITATLEAARSVFNGKRLAVVFQPHRFSRTKQCWDDFVSCFKDADYVFTTDIYPASEIREPWVEMYDKEKFFENIKGAKGSYLPSKEAIAEQIRGLIQQGELSAGDGVFVLGAGDINTVALALVNER
ncbi:UDP-N-acetylmuramate--L-alanine ligase [bacterium]|nr:UDP-N-acetylmuramate--L-alanine ligase [bacterium]